MQQNHAVEHQKAELLKDIVYAASDGIVTTFAVVAAVQGGKLAAITVVVLGFANLFADGFSMAVSNYLGTESEKEF
ncbi:MAG: VIT1/CCC1 transporter family protein, partial [Patescibacteria group bacterium]